MQHAPIDDPTRNRLEQGPAIVIPAKLVRRPRAVRRSALTRAMSIFVVCVRSVSANSVSIQARPE
jgi:hypothetical protein